LKHVYFILLYIYLVFCSTDSITIGPIEPIKSCFGSHTNLMSNFLVFKILVQPKRWTKKDNVVEERSQITRNISFDFIYKQKLTNFLTLFINGCIWKIGKGNNIKVMGNLGLEKWMT
jgi:hypothetical protein